MNLTGCDNDYLVVPTKPKPKVGKETDTLEAVYHKNSISSINDPYWKEVNFINVSLQDLNTQAIYEDDGLLNMTGTFNGITDFNQGNLPMLTLRAAYDDENIYILAEWDDASINISNGTWLWDGPKDPHKTDSTNGWTSQRNNDKIAFAFDLNGATTSAGAFTTIGCAASCHKSGNGNVMSPENGKVDIWNWSLALSEPFGTAFDMFTSSDSGLTFDAGQKPFVRNSNSPSNFRSGPAYEWNGEAQEITKIDGSTTILDPAFFLLNKTPFTGDPAKGLKLYENADHGCFHCHGEMGKGGGDYGDGPAFNNEKFTRKFSRTTLDDYASSDEHTGKIYYTKLNKSEKDDIVAYIRGLGGVPGYYLKKPVEGQSINDVTTNANVKLVRVDKTKGNKTYKILFTRKLNTGNDDDIKFDPESKPYYKFGVALMDNDGKNHIGSLVEIIKFIKQ